jgi:hypothetical protein
MRYIFFISVLLFFAGCKVSNEQFPIEPRLTFKSFSRDVVTDMDTVTIIAEFTDGDGDIGIPVGTTPRNDTVCVTPEARILTNPGFNFFYKDLRDSCTLFAATEYYQPNKGKESIRGEVVIRLGAFCKKVCGTPGCSDTAQFELTLRDRAGHLSNKIVTSKLVITGCQ